MMDTGTSKPPVKTRVAIVNMHFAMTDRPSIQCRLLKAGLTRVGHEVDVFYLNLKCATEFDPVFYRELAQPRIDLFLGDWLFSVAAFGYRANEGPTLLPAPLSRISVQSRVSRLRDSASFRNEIFPACIEEWAARLDWSCYSVVGFTSTFEQTTAAFSLARAIKQRHPRTITLFGGANFDGGMGKEYVRALDFIDYAVTGEADQA